jgi:hypothetical protein
MSRQESPASHSSLPLLKACLQNQCFSRGPSPQLGYSAAISFLCSKNNRLRPRNQSRHPTYISLRLQQEIEAARQCEPQLQGEDVSRLEKGNSGQQMAEAMFESDRQGLSNNLPVIANSQFDIDSLNKKFRFSL